MSLITPDVGLLFWMTLVFGIVLFLLGKFAFPTITAMVERRKRRIEQALEDAALTERRMAEWEVQQAQLLDEAHRAQAALYQEATKARERILAEAKAEAAEAASRLMQEAQLQIASERERALRDIRREVATLSIEVAQKILRRELSDKSAQSAFVDALVDEASRGRGKSTPPRT